MKSVIVVLIVFSTILFLTYFGSQVNVQILEVCMVSMRSQSEREMNS